MEIGRNIKSARTAAGLTQEQLAQQCGVATITIRQYESGKREPKYDTLERLADALNVPLEVLLGIGDAVFQTHLANGVHVYKNTFPFKVIEPFLEDPLSNSRDIAYQDEYLLISVDEDAAVTPDELEEIIDTYAPYRKKAAEEDAEFMLSIKEGEFHTRMNTAFFGLNFSGKQEAVKRVEELTEIPRYRAQKPTPAPPEGKDTTPAEPTPESAENGG